MRIYLDLCCLKRPFDLQEQPVIRLQTEAVLSILALPGGNFEWLQSPALLLENRLAARRVAELHVPVTDPVHFIEEISQWKH